MQSSLLARVGQTHCNSTQRANSHTHPTHHTHTRTSNSPLFFSLQFHLDPNSSSASTCVWYSKCRLAKDLHPYLRSAPVFSKNFTLSRVSKCIISPGLLNKVKLIITLVVCFVEICVALHDEQQSVCSVNSRVDLDSCRSCASRDLF